jgi:hypothetical protein
MGGAAQFLAQFFPLFLLGAVFGKLMDDSGSVSVIARFMTDRLGGARAVLAVVLAGAIVTYGGVSLFVAIFVIVPMAQGLFKAADIPPRLMPAAVALGTMTFTMSALPGTPALQNAIPMPFFGTTPFAAPGLGIIAAAIMLNLGLWWLGHAEAIARARGEGYGKGEAASAEMQADQRERATIASAFDPAEIEHGAHARTDPTVFMALLPLIDHSRQPRDESLPAAAAGYDVSRRRALGSNLVICCRRRLASGRGARGGARGYGRIKLSPAAIAQDELGCWR